MKMYRHQIELLYSSCGPDCMAESGKEIEDVVDSAIKRGQDFSCV